MLDTVFAIIFYSLLGVYLYKNRDKVQREAKIILLVRMKKGVKFIEKWGRKLSGLWKALGTVGVIVGVGGMLVITWLFIQNSITMFSAPSQASPTYFVIPGVKIPGSPIFIPFVAGILSIIILAVTHEFAHGLVAAAERIKIKSVGWGLFLLFPLAFVEMEEDEMKTASRMSKLRIFSAGSFANITAAIIFGLILYMGVMPAFTPLITFDGIELAQVDAGSPAEEAGLKQGMIITGINGQEVNNLSQATSIMNEVEPGEVISVQANQSVFNVTTEKDPTNSSRAVMDVFFSQHWSFKEENFKTRALSYVQTFFFWLTNLNFMVGIMNLLPIIILDGGKVLAEVFGYALPRKQALKAVSAVSNVLVVLLLFNLVGSYVI